MQSFESIFEPQAAGQAPEKEQLGELTLRKVGALVEQKGSKRQMQ